MKTLAAAAALILPSLVHAETLSKEVSRENVDIQVTINAASVRCSALGYGALELKVDVPDLDWSATFNHRQLGEGKPCMTAGVCSSTLSPEILRAKGEGDIPTQLLVVHTEEAYVDRTHGTCSRELVEVLSMELHGIRFTHQRRAPLANLTAAQCLRAFR